jgi:hypothetical protein
MGLFSDIKKKAESAGRFLSTTGKGALRKLGEGAKSVRKLGKSIDDVTGGMAGMAFEASKSMPVIGAVTRNLDKGLGAAEKLSDYGTRAIELGERATKTRSLAGAKDVFSAGKGMYKEGRGYLKR